MADEKLPFTSHLEELRRRLIVCFIAVGIGFLASYTFKEEILKILMKPLLDVLPPGGSLVFTGLTEAFSAYLKVSLLTGIFIASPVVLYQIWSFVSPGLHEIEKRYVFPFVLFSTIFFVGGALFGYFVAFPSAFKYLMSFATETIRPLPSVKEYLSLSIGLLFAFGIVFELPLFVFFLTKIGVVDAKMLPSKRKYAIVIIFIVAAIVTPTPDAVNQLIMAVPLFLLYELSIWVAKVFGGKS
ncbi:MAG: twin-arginine translocase subunit TatC [Deltaproteobacteria bacterium CG12_big_fil_rev_8_21_14_0_65_43_10]|nr:MAG: twin arginine-targeting protein translocase TatC [Deltaproteobacteria bacterium CG2_30_43_15]PIQ45797.1 MAG: twin-arginine translocase subunit TatC [Deltaproteobacteria bacterium CG12_big_fil_rev_8_21_14_0_65_43_10]PIU85360.1 MAG: twin-arginine translocase subunit TatC [Deltaproteobacteria bacterium CG06_land_8_20_14_3_00_44_19]PIX23035.1 MAG: twin-arginine translocase subunit TatC [Deltaproteobacteria bacterium CG_4_8_14_3_um_filter_43_13]PJB39911.1 MAG: twin-arginine translocase subun